MGIFNYRRSVTLIFSFSDAIIFYKHVHTGRNIQMSFYTKKNILVYSMHDESECQNSSQCSSIEYHQTFIRPLYSFSQVHTVHIPCLCSVNNIYVLLYINRVLTSYGNPSGVSSMLLSESKQPKELANMPQ